MAKKRKLSTRIMTLSMSISLGVSILIGTVTIFVTAEMNNGNIESEMITIADQVSDTMEKGMDSNFCYLEGIATNKNVYGMTDDPVGQKMLLKIYAYNRNYQDIGFANLEGKTLNRQGTEELDISDREYFKAAVSGQRYVTTPFPDTTQEGAMIMVFAVPVYMGGNSVSGDIVGVLYLIADGNFLGDIINEVSFGKTGVAYMVDAEGTVIAAADQERVYNQENIINQFSDDPSYAGLVKLMKDVISCDTGYNRYKVMGQDQCIGYATLENYGWHVMVNASAAEMFRGQAIALQCDIVLFVVTLLLSFLATIVFTKKIVGPVVSLNRLNTQLAEGDLTAELDENDSRIQDEIGQMATATGKFVSKLKEVVGETKISSESLYKISSEIDELVKQSNEAADGICKAVDDISQASVSQASEVDDALNQMGILSESVDRIQESVNAMLELATAAEASENDSTEALNQLINSSEKTTVAFNEIANQISETNRAIEKISNAADLITAIASQTNLLSLNASIEAARAGEAGKGFAVVASEIQTLSVQSDDAANTIQQIVRELTEESEKTIAKMNETLELIKEQQERLSKTREESDEVNSEVGKMEMDAKDIEDNVKQCVQVKLNVEDIVEKLAALSQENAASTEETNASMEELTANIGIIANSAASLIDIAGKLQQEMEFWQL